MKNRDVMLNTDAHRPAFNDFADALREAGNAEGWRSSETLRNWLDFSFRALRAPALKLHSDDSWERNEAEYMKLVKACRKPEVSLKSISTMLGACTLALMAEPIDFIGPVFSTLSADDYMGQFFTPHHLCALMARMTIDDAKVLLETRPYITLQEPACGVGGMVLATNAVLREQGLDIARQTHWHCTDVDYRAMAGCFIQMQLTDSSGVVVHGDTLRATCHMATGTAAAYAFPKRFEVQPVDAVPPVDVPAVVLEPVSIAKVQLSLFE